MPDRNPTLTFRVLEGNVIFPIWIDFKREMLDRTRDLQNFRNNLRTCKFIFRTDRLGLQGSSSKYPEGTIPYSTVLKGTILL
jgi:hypothetical protein